MRYLLALLLIFAYSSAFSSVYSLDKLLEIGEKTVKTLRRWNILQILNYILLSNKNIDLILMLALRIPKIAIIL